MCDDISTTHLTDVHSKRSSVFYKILFQTQCLFWVKWSKLNSLRKTFISSAFNTGVDDKEDIDTIFTSNNFPRISSCLICICSVWARGGWRYHLGDDGYHISFQRRLSLDSKNAWYPLIPLWEKVEIRIWTRAPENEFH